ncbi:MAG: helix-turn-helix domain-containing protein [Fibrobacterota bacterium]
MGNISASLGQKIKKIRNELGLSLEDFANESGLSSDEIEQIENGDTDITLSALEGLSKGLGLPSPAILLADKEELSKILESMQ